MSKVHPIRLPDSFYLPRLSRCGFEIRDVMPWEDAIAYVTDGTRFGVQFRDGSVDWLIRPEGAGSAASGYRLAHDMIPAGIHVDTAIREVVQEIWRENGALMAALEPGSGTSRVA